MLNEGLFEHVQVSEGTKKFYIDDVTFGVQPRSVVAGGASGGEGTHHEAAAPSPLKSAAADVNLNAAAAAAAAAAAETVFPAAQATAGAAAAAPYEQPPPPAPAPSPVEGASAGSSAVSENNPLSDRNRQELDKDYSSRKMLKQAVRNKYTNRTAKQQQPFTIDVRQKEKVLLSILIYHLRTVRMKALDAVVVG